MNTAVRGFTLIELMVVISIIGILAGIVFVGARPAGEQSRDTQRQSDLRQVQTALGLYKNRHGRYPEGCNAAESWSGQTGTDYACGSTNAPYILGNIGEGRAFAEFMVNLPTDPKLNEDDSGYVYTVNSDGSVYKFMAKNTVEAEVVTADHPFTSCAASCAGSPSHCSATSDQFQTSYAVWGGFAALSIASSDAQVQSATEEIICDIP